jgi:hypothetical protein
VVRVYDGFSDRDMRINHIIIIIITVIIQRRRFHLIYEIYLCGYSHATLRSRSFPENLIRQTIGIICIAFRLPSAKSRQNASRER